MTYLEKCLSKRCLEYTLPNGMLLMKQKQHFFLFESAWLVVLLIDASIPRRKIPDDNQYQTHTFVHEAIQNECRDSKFDWNLTLMENVFNERLD